MEKEIKIKIPDSKYIYGILSAAKKKSDTLIIFTHGFTGHNNEHLFFNGAHFFAEKGIDTFRLNLYSYQKDARNMKETSMSLHGEDITAAVKFFRKKYKKIFVAGHSFGGTALLFVDSALADGLIFLDASYVNSKAEWIQKLTYNKGVDGYVLDGAIQQIIGKKFIDELKSFPDGTKLIQKIHVPILFITAGKMGNFKAGQKYLKAANIPKKLIDIKGATHSFDNWQHEQKVLGEIYTWVKKGN